MAVSIPPTLAPLNASLSLKKVFGRLTLKLKLKKKNIKKKFKNVKWTKTKRNRGVGLPNNQLVKAVFADFLGFEFFVFFGFFEFFWIFVELHEARDDVVRVLVDELEEFEELIGGQIYTPKIMPLFEKLCYVDDSYTREKW